MPHTHAPTPVTALAQSPVDIDRLLDRLAERGYRMTEPRRQIVAELVQRGSSTAQELYEGLRRSGSGIGRATVFRTVELLSQLGVLERVHLPDGCHTYVVTQPGHHHHLICSDCGVVLEVAECGLDDWLNRLGQQTAFQIQGHWLEVFGLCQTCQQSA